MVDYAQATKNFETSIAVIKECMEIRGLSNDPTIVYLLGHLENNQDYHVDNMIDVNFMRIFSP